MNEYLRLLLPIGGGVLAALLTAWLTGAIRSYGSHLERLADLAAKMPEDTEARRRLDAAVQEEASRLLRVPARVRRRYWVLIFLAWPLYFEGMARWTQLWGASEPDAYREALYAPLFLLLLWQAWVVVRFHGSRVREALRQQRAQGRAAAALTEEEAPPDPPAPRPPGHEARSARTSPRG